MAGVPCFNDTCSTIVSVDGSGKIDINSRLDPAGGISCGTDADPNSGLRINMLGNPSPVAAGSVSECDNLLGYTTDGLLFSQRPRYEIYEIDGALKDVPNSGTSDDSLNFDITNPSDCDKLAFVTIRFTLIYNVLASGPYKLGIFDNVNIPGKFNTSNANDVGGSNAIGGDVDTKFNARYINTFFGVTAGQTITIQCNTNNQVSVNATANGTNLGTRARAWVAMLDLAAGDVFGVTP